MNSSNNKTLEINEYNNYNVDEETKDQASSDSGKSVDNGSSGSSDSDDNSDTQEDRIIFSKEFKTYCQLQFDNLPPNNEYKHHYNWVLIQGKQSAARVAWNAFKESKDINLKRQLVQDVGSDEPNRKRASFAKEDEESVVSLDDGNIHRREMEEMRKMMMEAQRRAEQERQERIAAQNRAEQERQERIAAQKQAEEAQNRAEQERQDKLAERQEKIAAQKQAEEAAKRAEQERHDKLAERQEKIAAQKQAEEAEKRVEQERQDKLAERQEKIAAQNRAEEAEKQAEQERQDKLAERKMRMVAEEIARNADAISPIEAKKYFTTVKVTFPVTEMVKSTSQNATNNANHPLVPSTIYKMESDVFIQLLEGVAGNKLHFNIVKDIEAVVSSQFYARRHKGELSLTGSFILLLNALTNTLNPFRNDQGTKQLYGWRDPGNRSYLGDMNFCNFEFEDPLLIAENKVPVETQACTLDPTSNFCAIGGQSHEDCINESCYCNSKTGNPIRQLHTYMTSGTKTSYFGMYSTYKTNMPVIYLANDAVLYVDSPPAEETPYMYVLLMLVLKENLGDKLRNVLNEKFNFPINSYENDNDNIKEVRKEASQRQNGGKDKQNDMETQNENSSNSMNIYENFTRLSLGTENTEIIPSLENITQRYTIEHIKFEVIGYGRSGEVLRTAVFGKDCALKTADSFKDFEGDAMLENELEIYKHLKRNKLCGTVVPIIIGGGYTREGFRGIATEYIPSETLDTREEEANFKASAREGLKKLHDIGVLHNDIKIENILCKQKKAVFIDFGIAKILDREKYEKDFVNEVKALELLLDTI